MAPARKPSPASTLDYLLAGLQAGMVAAFWMLVWLGISAMWMHRSFFNPMNIMATVFFKGDGIHRGFASTTPSGIALYLLNYSVLGAVFALAAKRRLTGLGTVLVSVLVSLGWYWVWFRLLALEYMPLVWLLHAERATQFGHVIYGALLARFGDYLPRVKEPVIPATGSEPAD
ncbi:MAG: hypothetical protein KGN36_08890 [Acidobacteriota bacterium]|nr:hypothetical protein [Acidobacteriota bacterium]